VLATIRLKRFDLLFIVGKRNLVPVQPPFPAIGHGVSHLDLHDASAFPVLAPPGRRVNTAKIMRPPLGKMLGNGTFDFLNKPGPGNSHEAVRLHKSGEVIQVQVVRAVINEGIDGDDRVEKLRGERKRTCIRVDWKDTLLHAGIADPLEILCGTEPQVSCPYLNSVFTVQKDRGRSTSAREVQHAHAGLKLEGRAKPLGQPKRIRAAAGACDDPFGIVPRGAREPIGEESLVRGLLDFSSQRIRFTANYAVQKMRVEGNRMQSENKSPSSAHVRKAARGRAHYQHSEAAPLPRAFDVQEHLANWNERLTIAKTTQIRKQ
jgi:hypothetical protein